MKLPVMTRVRVVVLFVLIGLLGARPAAADDLILYDEDAASQFRQLNYVTEDPAAAHDGERGLLFSPTYWHYQYLRLSPGRTDFRPYDRLEFYIRSVDHPVHPVIVAWDYASSNELTVSDYVDGGVIDTAWRLASIPLADLASTAFPLDSVFLVGFLPAGDQAPGLQTPYPFHVDDIVLRDARTAHLTHWSMPSNRVVSLAFDRLNPDTLGQSADFSLQSETDAAFAAPVAPLRLGAERIAIDVTDSGNGVVTETRVHLLFPEPLLAGHDYQLTYAVTAPSGLTSTDSVSLRFEPDAVSSSIKVNQVGYQPDATKIAMIGNWLGDLGPMPVDDTTFAVVNATTGESVLSGALRLRIADDPRSGEDVYEADFSALSTPGTYRVALPGLGQSHPFEIAHDVFEDVYRTTMRVFYHKRNTRLTAPYAEPGFEREGIHELLDAAHHPILSTYPLSRGELPYEFRPIQGGWYDAGDYGHYVHNAAPVWATISLALDLAEPGHFRDSELNIPESGNGVPDILDELRWGMQWALSMQDDDGGVYWRVSSGHWDLGLPADVSEPRLIYEKTTRATAQFAAMAAIYGRLIAAYDPAESNAVLNAARAAWNYANTQPFYPAEGELYQNPSEEPGGGTYAVRSAKPDLLWAAAELYRGTGDPAYQDAYRELLDVISFDISAAPMSTWAYWAMTRADHATRDVILLERARRTLMVAADTKLLRMDQSPYRSAKHPNIPYTGWYNFSVPSIPALALLQAYHLSGEPEYLDKARQLLDIMLGANPQSKTYLTGIGDDPVLDPMDRISLNDANEAPLPGLAVAGPTWHLPAFREPYTSVNTAYWPPEQPTTEGDYRGAYPVLRRWIDQHDLINMNESTVREWAPVAISFGLLRDAEKPVQVSDRPYAWTPHATTATGVIRLHDIPPADVPLLTAAQITAFGDSVAYASSDHLAALTPAQVAAIAAPAMPYWVAKLSLEQQLSLTPAQIAAFTHWSLYTALPAARVPLIPPAKMPMLGVEIRNTSSDWKAAITAEQRAAMTDAQRDIMLKAGY